MPNGKLTLLGCGLGHDSLEGRALEIAASADVLAGGKRLLDLFPSFSGERVVIGADACASALRLLEMAKTKRVAVLASGDPLLHGIGGTFARLNSGTIVEAIPNVSAMQALCAKLLQPWDSLRLFSVHGSAVLQWREILSSPLSAVYCDNANPACKVAAAILGKFPDAASRPAAIAEGLGSSSERVLRGSLAEMAQASCGALSILALLPSASPFDDGLSLGLPDASFSCEGRMITHPELRAVALSKLRLGPGVMWDVGAGSGSVGIEASLLANGLKVYAIEKDLERASDIESNAAKLGASSLELVKGMAPGAFAGLPRPRSVFIGGGGNGIEEIFNAVWESLLPGGTIVAVAALLETRASLSRLMPERCSEVLSISVSRSSKLLDSRLMKAENPSDLFVFRKPFEEPK